MTCPLPHLLDLLHQATDLKLLRHQTADALALLLEAEQLCVDHPQLPRALRGLVAYRMGHLRMRVGGDTDVILEAEQDFHRACHLQPRLEPWVGLYHMAVLGRLTRLELSERSAADIQHRLAVRWVEVLRVQATLDPTAEPDRDDPVVQRGSLNAAEALAYALGLDTSGIEGLGALEHALQGDSPWGFLVVPVLDASHVHLPWELLPDTLAQLRQAQPNALAFLLPSGEVKAALWRPGEDEPRHIGRQHALLLTWMLTGCPGGYERLMRTAFTRNAKHATRRKLLQRCRELLAQATNRPSGSVILRDEHGALRLAPELVILGAVHGESCKQR